MAAAKTHLFLSYTQTHTYTHTHTHTYILNHTNPQTAADTDTPLQKELPHIR